MKNTLKLLLMLVAILANVQLAQAQRGRKTVVVKKTPNKKVVVVKQKHRPFKRNKVVIVKKRPVHQVAILPAGYTTIIYKNNTYHYNNGKYYKNNGNTYVIVNPPRGMRIKTIAPIHKVIVVNQVNYYYAQGTFYTKDSSDFEVVTPPTGAVVNELPEDNVEEISIDGNTYYEHNDYLYKKVDAGYEVVGKLED